MDVGAGLSSTLSVMFSLNGSGVGRGVCRLLALCSGGVVASEAVLAADVPAMVAVAVVVTLLVCVSSALLLLPRMPTILLLVLAPAARVCITTALWSWTAAAGAVMVGNRARGPGMPRALTVV